MADALNMTHEEDTPVSGTANRAVQIWLWCLALAVVAMVVVGGATRLTDSGLSITEWRPVTGVIPPLSVEAWEAELEKYRQIPEYQQINKGMSLDEFKVIYWWEWGHRFLGRFVGVLFLVPFLWFWWRGHLSRRMTGLTLVAFALGGLQGFIGWWMVTSGLSVRTDVSQYRLATHLGLAVIIFGYLVWLARQAGGQSGEGEPNDRIRNVSLLLVPLIFLQIVLGAFVAGLDAGLTYNTWPLMDGELIPNGLLTLAPWWLNPFENITAVQFNHRVLAYVLAALVAWHAVDCWRTASHAPTRRRAAHLGAVTLVQVALGIAALLYVVPLGLALAHQVTAIALFGLAVVHADASRKTA